MSSNDMAELPEPEPNETEFDDGPSTSSTSSSSSDSSVPSILSRLKQAPLAINETESIELIRFF